MSPSTNNVGENKLQKKLVGRSSRGPSRSDQAQRRTGGEDGGHKADEPAEHARQRLAFLCHDLRTFTSNPDAAERLNASVYPHFIGPPYLTEDHAQYALRCALRTLRYADRTPAPDDTATEESGGSKTLATFLEDGVANLVAARDAKRDSNNCGMRDFVLCTSHDLAPLLQEACGFSKEHFGTRAFKDAYKRWEKEVRKAEKKGKGKV